MIYLHSTVGCTGLNAEWESTIQTETQFPVDPGTMVEVTCSDSGALNKGSSKVTCASGTEFTHSKEPSCSIRGKLKGNSSKSDNSPAYPGQLTT